MKLNLLPATVSKGRQSKTAWIASIFIIFVGIGIGLVLTLSSAAALKQAQEDYQASKGPAEAALKESQKADAFMALPEVAALMKNVSLAQAMIAHNDKYPDLYNSLRGYVPPFFRLTSMSASPSSDTQTSVTLTGTLDSYQQYADLMLALMRNPEAVSVARSGYTADEKFVPQITEADQLGRPRRPDEAPIPDDPLQRLAFFEAQGAQQSGFTGVGNFGTPDPDTRGAMPGESLVTVSLILNRGMQTPNPAATIGSGGGTTGGGGAPNGPPRGIPTGPPPGVGGSGPGAGRGAPR
ncbi:MAG: hypothetical protein ACAH95_17470 [Fimbriimonas sp.]